MQEAHTRTWHTCARSSSSVTGIASERSRLLLPPRSRSCKPSLGIPTTAAACPTAVRSRVNPQIKEDGEQTVMRVISPKRRVVEFARGSIAPTHTNPLFLCDVTKVTKSDDCNGSREGGGRHQNKMGRHCRIVLAVLAMYLSGHQSQSRTSSPIHSTPSTCICNMYTYQNNDDGGVSYETSGGFVLELRGGGIADSRKTRSTTGVRRKTKHVLPTHQKRRTTSGLSEPLPRITRVSTPSSRFWMPR